MQALDATVLVALAGLLGLLVGSFLNVVIHRLPLMMERRWAAECAELAGREPDSSPALNLWRPRSRCPSCGGAIAWYRNLPVLSFLLLKGRCGDCGARIAWRYPVVELATGGLFAWVAAQHGASLASVAWAAFAAALLVLGFIDWDTTLLPDDITLPLAWGGLLAAVLGASGVTLESAFWGALGSYLSLWSIYWAFKIATGKEGMGYGDFKLFAALGAWFGWTALIPLILIASVVGAVVGIGLKISGGLREGGYVPFGPFLALAGLAGLFVGPSRLLTAIGL